MVHTVHPETPVSGTHLKSSPVIFLLVCSFHLVSTRLRIAAREIQKKFLDGFDGKLPQKPQFNVQTQLYRKLT